MDISKLTPAPWYARGEQICCGLYQGSYESHGVQIFPEDGGTWADTEFAALARNAFDVMMRRGWGIESLEDGRWVINDKGRKGWLWLDGRNFFAANLADIYTALVEADRWYKENVKG